MVITRIWCVLYVGPYVLGWTCVVRIVHKIKHIYNIEGGKQWYALPSPP
jgi:hypothetical protein